jgi:hypothetical protein
MKLSVIKWLLGKGYRVDIAPSINLKEVTEIEMIEKVMENFDFKKVHRTMVALNWKWLIDHELEIPSERVVRSNARRHLVEVVKYAKSIKDEVYHHDIPITHGSGGFKALAFLSKDKSRVEVLQLYFIVTEWDAYSIEEQP